MIFNYPINILCFNRPDYLRELLVSMKMQTVQLPSQLLHFWVDGFAGSKDENLVRENKTNEVMNLIKQFFPDSNVYTSSKNLGIALNYWRAELNSFENMNATSAFFLEEDLVLSPRYFELTLKMDDIFNQDFDVSHLSPTGDVTESASEMANPFQNSGHFWGYLLRGWHHFERRELICEYLSFIEKQSYFLRGGIEEQILEHFFGRGIALAGSSQDAVKDALRHHFGRISVTTVNPWASNIGVVGEHFQVETPHHNRRVMTDTHDIPDYIDTQNRLSLVESSKVKVISQVFLNYVKPNRLLISERDALISERDALISERDALISERDALRRLNERQV